jgi:hypothetical protein
MCNIDGEIECNDVLLKSWLVYFKHFFTYTTQHCNKDSDETNRTFFSITVRRGTGKPVENVTLIAYKNMSTGIYHFDDMRFTSYSDMLDYILELKEC